jgi:hypothetical protein
MGPFVEIECIRFMISKGKNDIQNTISMKLALFAKANNDVFI